MNDQIKTSVGGILLLVANWLIADIAAQQLAHIATMAQGNPAIDDLYQELLDKVSRTEQWAISMYNEGT